MRILLFCPLLLLSSTGAAQTAAQRDSLLRLAAAARTDTARVWALMETGKLYLASQPDTALHYLGSALELAQRIGFSRGAARCLINQSFAYNEAGRYRDAVRCGEAALPYCERLGMRKEYIAACNNLGNAWNATGNPWAAIQMYQKCLDAMPGVELPPHFPVTVRSNIAILYIDLGLFEKSLAYSAQSLAESRSIGDLHSEAYSLANIGTACLGLDRREEAYEAFRQAAELARKLEIGQLLANTLGNIADHFQHMGDLAGAVRLYDEALDIARRNGIPRSIMLSLHGQAALAMEQRQLGAARTLGMQALALADSMQDDHYRHSICLTLSDIALMEGDMPAFRRYRDEYLRLRSQHLQKSLVHALQELQTRYQTKEQEIHIRQLEQEREVQQLRLRLSWGGLAFASLLLGTAVIGYRGQRRRKLWAESQLKLEQQHVLQLEQEKQLATAQAMLHGQEEERARLARDLHDGLGGMLSGIKQSLAAQQPAGALAEAVRELDAAIGEMRHIARNLMPEALLRFGLRDALQDYCDHLRRSTGLGIRFQAFGMEQRLPRQAEVVLFRVAQELLNNTVRHAGASQALVQLLRDGDRVSLTVEDDGQGFDPAKLGSQPGIGWLNIQSRVAYLHGVLDLRTAPGQGTSAHIEIPLAA
ncbi:MAG: tetratricopeptide repeat protein [Bacteroidia bacterium]|nr:tetratricopeptide repeat protein [Bacteroidia bacterium]